MTFKERHDRAMAAVRLTSGYQTVMEWIDEKYVPEPDEWDTMISALVRAALKADAP